MLRAYPASYMDGNQPKLIAVIGTSPMWKQGQMLYICVDVAKMPKNIQCMSFLNIR